MSARGRRTAVISFALATAGFARIAHAQEAAGSPSAARLRIWVHGGFVPGSRDFTGTQTFTEFAEEGRIESQYREDPGPGMEIGLGVRVRRQLALTAAGSLARRDGAGSFAATLPHPLYFGAFRQAAGDFHGASQSEVAVHLDVAFLGGAGRLQWSAFAGPSLLRVRADLVQRVEYTQAYPFDSVTVTGTPLASARNHAFGFNAAGSLEWPVARHLAIGAQVRFSRATVALETTANDRVEIDAGGLYLTGGLRFDF